MQLMLVCYCAACLGSEYIAENDDWSCPDCIAKASSGDTPSNNTKPIIIRLTRVVKEVESENGGCVICRFVAEHVPFSSLPLFNFPVRF